MASELQLPLSTVLEIGRTATHRYRTYDIAKKSGGTRTIHHPSRALKALQRWLLRNVIERLPVHKAATAYREGKGIRSNAILHAGQRYLLRMDFKSFFPSILSRDIDRLILDSDAISRDWSEADRAWFLNIVTRRERLCIGAPTSPALSNAVCLKLDEALTAECGKRQVLYTRYADDLCFSCSVGNTLWQIPDLVERTIAGLEIPASLAVNQEKTRHSSKKRRQVITGLVLTSQGGVSAGRPIKRKVKGFIHRFETLTPEERGWLAGMIANLRATDPSFVNALAIKYGSERVLLATQIHMDRGLVP